MRNDYGVLVEEWKVDLILNRARRKGFRRDELEDVQQDILPALLGFRFDLSKSNGATEKTVLTALIDKRLAVLRRGRARRRKHEEKYRALHGAADGTPARERHLPSPEREMALAIDVRDALAKLTARGQAVCAALVRDGARTRIAEGLGLSRYELDKLIAGLRKQFRAIGLDAWMRDR